MSEKILEIDNLTVRYKSGNADVHAVNGISISLEKGKTVGIVGETGAGKTTTSLSIMNLLPERTGRIDSGTIKFKGKEILDMDYETIRSIRGKEISMIFQDPMTSLNPIFTVHEQLSEAVRMHNNLSKEDIDTKVKNVLNMVGISENRMNNFPHEFSGGMKQRVVIAMALINEPELLIADEPTTALDVTIQAQVLDLMKNLKRALNTSMILITHDLGVVSEMCDEVAIMYAGQIVEYGSLRDIYKGDKHHPYTVGLFGSIPNIKDKSKRLKPISGLLPDPTKLPVGCYFQDRCPHVMDKCRTIHPKYYINDNHKILCHLFEEDKHGQ